MSAHGDKNGDKNGNKGDKNVHVVNFGCRLNAYEGEVIHALAQRQGLDDCIFVNSCAVTNEAQRQVRQKIRSLKRNYPEKRIVVTGCAAQINPGQFQKMDQVDAIMGNQEKLDESAFHRLQRHPSSFMVGDIMQASGCSETVLPNDAFSGRARGLVEIQQGCDHRCTFCIIPYGRGPNRSRGIGDVVARTRRLVDGGCREVVLTGVDITEWGKDLAGDARLGDLVRALLDAVPELTRLRLSSLDPAEIDSVLMELLCQEKRLLPYIHLSVQSGDDMILKRMKRRHCRQDVLSLCQTVRKLRPEMAFGADFITGFPTEDEDMFGRSLSLMQQCRLIFAHVFPFSPHEGTPAAKMPPLPQGVARQRAWHLREEAEKLLRVDHRQRIGHTVSILAEGAQHGRCEHYCRVRWQEGTRLAGDIFQARVETLERDNVLLIQPMGESAV